MIGFVSPRPSSDLNDVFAAFAGYSGQRELLFGVTVELYELRPEPGPVRNRLLGASSKAGLHIESLKLAAQVIAFKADSLPLWAPA